ncbi:sigma factor [Nitratireductor sp. StC3]|uniref:RNA polymerase sigma factor n=1 Tax=Nitratireductor sp. StC3 TaxID=2126741 RepID=UPI000D0D208F|nr:sigma factor [Nitratireductor sp. StC3]PSM20260.1 transcriptional regulator [Nitratireductor sp. StC3]
MNHARHYTTLLEAARRHARRPDEAEDIVQEVLLSAFAVGRIDMSKPENRRWIAGAIRNRAAFDARSAMRRKIREAQWQQQAEPAHDDAGTDAPIPSALPKSLRVVAALALSGHTRREIAYLLGLTDTAVRQRVSALRKALAQSGSRLPGGLPGLSLDLPYGRIRQGLRPYLARKNGDFASHDPDGHVFLIRRSQKSRARQR